MRASPPTPDALLRRCVIQVRLIDGSFRGSGFFVAPGFVVTCAHVVPAPGTAVIVRWDDQDLAATVDTTFPADGVGGGDYHPFPDLALLRLGNRVPDHPCVRLAEAVPAPGETVTAAGFTTATPSEGTRPDSLLLTVAGPADRYLRVIADQVVPGFSGSPVADSRTGKVVGVVKASRDIGAVHGGWLTPVDAVLDVLGPGLAEANSAHHRRSVPLPLPPELADLMRAERAAAANTLDGQPIGPVPLSAVYVEQSLDDLNGTGDAPGVFRNRPHLVIEGPPGAGKSTLLRHLVRQASGWWLTEDGDTADPATALLGAVLPVTLRAVDLVDSTLADALARRPLGLLGARPDPAVFTRRPLPDVSWLVLVDGLDEVTDERARTEIIGRLAAHMAEPGEVHRFLVTTRPLADKELTPVHAVAGPAYRLRPLEGAAFERFARLWFAARSPESADADAAAFLAEVERSRMRQLLGLPLLATIAAHVRTSMPDGRLPRTRSGLYREFIRHLVHERAATTRAHLVERLGHVEANGRFLADVLLAQRDRVLEAVARHHVRDPGTPLLDTALSTLDVDGDVLLPPDWSDAVRALLLGTGVVVRDGDDLGFLHRSFAEYLAAAPIVAEIGPTREAVHPYVDGVIYPSATSDLAEFVVERWGARPDSDVDGVLSWYVLYERHRHGLSAAANLIACGLPAGDLLPLLLVRLGNRILDGVAPYAEVLERLVDQPEALDKIRSLAEDERVTEQIRIYLTGVLARFAPEPTERAEALELLRRWAEDQTDHSLPAYFAALALEAIDPEAGRRALRRLVDGVDSWVRINAAKHLARLGESDELTAVLTAVASDPAVPVSNRALAIDELRTLGSDHAGPLLEALAGGAVTAEPGWMRVATRLPDGDVRTALVRRVAADGDRAERIEAARELRWSDGKDHAVEVLLALLDDPGVIDEELLAAMLAILGEEETIRALQQAADPARGWQRAIAAATGLIDIGHRAQGVAALRAVFTHPDPAASIATAAALHHHAAADIGKRALRRMARGRHPTALRRVDRKLRMAASTVLVARYAQDKWLSTIRRLARSTDGILTAAHEALVRAGGYSDLAARFGGILTDLLDTADTDAARADAATALLNTTDWGRERGETELRRLRTADDPGEPASQAM